MQVPQTEVLIRRADGVELVRAVLPPGEYVLGRDDACTLRIDDPSLSQRHAQLTINFDHALIEDLGSDNGTLVNGQPVTDSVRLWPGQRIQVGSATVELHRQKSEPRPDVSLAPNVKVAHTLLPTETLRDRRYDIGGVVARGGMGAILSATETAIERAVAMKVMLENASPDDLVRFIAEAKVTGQLEHPNIVPVHELGVDENDQVFYTMKFVRGTTLRKVLELMAAGTKETLEKYPLGTLLTIFQKVCDAVAFAHSKGVIHRDLKPENIMLGDYGEVLLMDWGLAKVLEEDSSPSSSAVERADTVHSVRREMVPEASGATMGGTILGTPQYMAPEQARGEAGTVDERADIYGLGAILYHILTLRPSVTGEHAWEIVDRVARGEIDPLDGGTRAPGASSKPNAADDSAQPNKRARSARFTIPDSLAAVVRKAMAFDKAQRYASVADLQADITAYQNGFATGAEHAGLAKQLVLLIKRNRGIFATAAAAWLLITALAVWFVINLRAKERRAVAGEQSAVTEAGRAAKAEAIAVQEKETTRQALAKSQLDLAEKEFERGKFVEAQRIIEETPESFRDANWRFLRTHSRDFTAQLSLREQGDARRLQFLPGGDGFAARSVYGSVCIYTSEGQQTGEFPVPRTGYDTFGIDSAGSRLALAASANEVAVVEVASGKLVRRWTCEIDAISDVLISPDGETVLAGGGQTLIAYATQTGAPLWTQPYHGVVPAFSPDGGTVATVTARAGPALKIQILDTRTGATRSTFEAMADNPTKTTLQFNRAGDRLACIGGDEVILWNAQTGAKIRALHFPGETVNLLSPGGDAVATFSGSRIRLWDTTTGRLLRSLNGASREVIALAFNPDGKVLLSAHLSSHDGVVNVWPTRLGETITTVRPGTTLGRRVIFDRDASCFYAAAEREAGAWETRSGSPKWKFTTRSRDIRELSVHPIDGSIALAELYYAAFGHLSPAGEVLESFGTMHNASAKFSRSGQLLLAVSDAFNQSNAGTDFSVMEYPAGNVLRKIPLENPHQPFSAFCLDDTAVATAAINGGLTIWDWKSGTPLRQIAAPQTGSIGGLASSPDGRHLVSGGPDRWIRVWEAATGRLEAAFRAHWEGVRCVEFSPDGREIFSGSEDGTVRIHDAATGEEKLAIYGHTTPVVDVDVSADGALIAAITADGFVKVWDRKSSSDAALLPKKP